MKRAAQGLLIIGLFILPTAVFADVFPLNPPPDLFIDTFVNTTGATPSLTGTVESITDSGACNGGCYAGLNFTQDGFQVGDTFEVTDGSDDVYLEGTLDAFVNGGGGEYGELFTVTVDNNALWTALEGQTASSFTGSVVMDLHSFNPLTGGYQYEASADMTPAGVIPEPATLTLLCTGLAAGLLRRKRLAQAK